MWEDGRPPVTGFIGLMRVPISHQRSGNAVCCALFFARKVPHRWKQTELVSSCLTRQKHSATWNSGRWRRWVVNGLGRCSLTPGRVCFVCSLPTGQANTFIGGAVSAGCVLAKNNNLVGLRKVNDCGCGATTSRLHLNFSKVSRGWRIKRMEDCSLPDCADTDSQLSSLWACRRGKSWFFFFFHIRN